MKKLLTLLCSALLLTGVVAGCGGTTGPNDDSNYEFSISPDKSVAETITVGINTTDTGEAKETAIIEDVAKLLKKDYPNVNVKVIKITGNYNEQIMQFFHAEQVKPGSMPNILWSTTTGFTQLSEKKLLINLGSYIDASKSAGIFNPADYIESTYASGQQDGKQYLMPRSTDRVVTHLNKRIFREAGVPLPKNNDWTWTDFLNTLDALKKSSVYAGSVQYPLAGYLTWEPVYNAILTANGAKIIDKDKNILIDTNEMRNGMKMMQNLIDKKYTSATAGGFEAGIAAMAFHSFSAGDGINYIGEDYDVVSFPRIGDNPKVGVGASGFAMFNGSTQQKRDLSWQFMLRLLSKDGQEAMAKNGINSVPIRKDMQDPAENLWGKDFSGKINVNAFVANPEYDCEMDFYKVVSADYQTNLIKAYKKYVSDYLNAQYNLEQSISKFKEDILNAFEF